MRLPKTSLFCLLIMIFAISSCDFLGRNNIEGTWFYTHNTGIPSGTFTLTPASFLSLAPDHNFTLDFGSFEWGTWQQTGDTLILHGHDKTRYFLATKKDASNLQISTGPGVDCNFEKQVYSFSKDESQPYSLSDNKWRIKAESKESTKQLSLRLANHCRFWKDYFAWALNNHIDYVDVRSTPTAIKIYNNGFAIKTYDDLPREWKHLFYDEEDCRQANDMLETVFRSNDIAWAHTDNKYKMFIGAFEQLERLLTQYQGVK